MGDTSASAFKAKGTLNESSSVFHTRQLGHEMHRGTLQSSERSCGSDQMSTRQPQNETRRAGDHMTHSNHCEEGADVSMKRLDG